MKRSRALLVTPLALLLAAPGFAQEEPLPPDWKAELEPEDSSWKEVEQVFTFNNGAEPETLDPHIMTGVPEHRLAMAIFEGLVTHHPETLQAVPAGAESWSVSDDALTWTFKLRADAKWSNGTQVVANDYLRSWERALRPETACQYAYQFYPIQGAQAYNLQGTADEYPKGVTFADTVAVKAPDDYTLVVTLAQPCSYFLDLCAFETLMPIPMDVVEEHGDKWVRPENLVCNGPFKVSEWLHSQRVVFVPNEHYWDAGFVKLQKIVALPYEDTETAYKLFQQGACDWNTTVPAAKIDEVKRLPEYYVFPYLGSYFYRVNVTKPPFNDVRVRKALSLAIDREVITRDILQGGQVPATWFTPQLPTYVPPKGLPYDRAAAKALLAEAGYPEGKGFPEVNLIYNTNEAHKQVAEVVVQQWKENLGIKVSLNNREWKVYLNDVQHLQYQIARAAWIGDYTDANTFLDMFVTGGGNNQTGWSHAKYDGLIAAAAAERDGKKRAAIFQQAERILIEEEFPILPIYIYVNQGLLAEKVGGWYENVRDQHPFQYIYIEPVE